jgi:isopentenyl phosphate kinase
VNGTVTATAQSNCASSNTRSINVKLPACPLERLATVTGKGSFVAAEAMNVQVFPNPTTTDFKLQVITAGKEKINARVLDAQGRMIKQVTVQPYQTVNFGSDLKAGAYILEVKQGTSVKSTRIIKF